MISEQYSSHDIYKLITKLIDSKITAYRISSDTGLQHSLISRLRNGETKIENVTLKKAMIMYDYANTHLK